MFAVDSVVFCGMFLRKPEDVWTRKRMKTRESENARIRKRMNQEMIMDLVILFFNLIFVAVWTFVGTLVVQS